MERYEKDKEVFNLPKVICSALEEARNQEKDPEEWDDHSDSGYSIWSNVV